MLHKRNLPHLYFNDGIYFITYRLINTIPLETLALIHSDLKSIDSKRYERIIKKYDSVLDSGEYGKNYLRIKEVAKICETTLQYSDGKDYKLICYTIMPNHIHLVFELLSGNKGISKIMQAIKRISARRANLFLHREGSFWQDESFDRWIRSEKELYFVIKYVLLNPVNAELVNDWNDWEYTYCNKNYLVL